MIFVAVDFPKGTAGIVLSIFSTLRVMNTILLEEINEFLFIYMLNPLKPGIFYTNSAESLNFDVFFPTKLTNANGYKFGAIFIHNSPYMKILANGRTLGIDLIVINIITEHLNASLSFHMFKKNEEGMKSFIQGLDGDQYDMSIDKTVQNIGLESISIFEDDGFCALLPFPTHRNLFDMILKPFDTWTWILILISLISSAIAWQLINYTSNTTNQVSSGYFVFSFIAYFIGQSIPFREHSFKQKVLLQLSILLTFVLGNAYQSLIISYISDARLGNKITSIDEMLNKNFTYRVDEIFYSMFESSDDYPELKSRITGPIGSFTGYNYRKLAADNVAIIMSCHLADFHLSRIDHYNDYDETPINFYYKLPDKLYSFYHNYWMAHRSLFGSRIQELICRIFESGIKQHWNEMIPSDDLKEKKLREYYENEEYLLNLKDFKELFYILIGGYVASTLAFLIEILIDRFVCKFAWRNFIRKFTLNRLKRRERKFRITQVRPAEIF